MGNPCWAQPKKKSVPFSCIKCLKNRNNNCRSPVEKMCACCFSICPKPDLRPCGDDFTYEPSSMLKSNEVAAIYPDVCIKKHTGYMWNVKDANPGLHWNPLQLIITLIHQFKPWCFYMFLIHPYPGHDCFHQTMMNDDERFYGEQAKKNPLHRPSHFQPQELNLRPEIWMMKSLMSLPNWNIKPLKTIYNHLEII